MAHTNRNFVLNIVSIAVAIYGITMIPSIIMAVRYHETGIYTSMSAIALVCIPVGLIGYKMLPNTETSVRRKTCYLTTISCWIIVIMLSAVPYYAAGEGYSFIDCIFESSASWATTGINAIPVSGMPIGLKFWRSTCNWLGGVGIILLTLTFLPSWQFVGHKLVTTEIRGPVFLMSTTTFRKTYRRILLIYFTITITQYIALRLAGMNQFNSILTTMSNTSTSGLQHINNGTVIGLSMPVKIILTIFAFAASSNVTLAVSMLLGKFDRVRKSSEMKFYIAEILIVSTVLTITLQISAPSPEEAFSFGDVLMQIVSFASTAGYIVTDCRSWGAFETFAVTAVMLIGACSFSTGGGIKASRAVFACKTLSNNNYMHVHPHATRSISYNGKPISKEAVGESNTYVALFIITFLIGGLLLTVDGTDVYSALSYCLAALTNSGTPVYDITNAGIVSDMSTFSKAVMSVLMLCGRLEIYPVLMLFTARIWRLGGVD